MRKYIFSCLFAVIVCFVCEAAPHPFFTRYSDDDGLTDYNITQCCQDAFGRIWVATNSGVYFYTGNKFTPFREEHYQATCSTTTLSIGTDRDGCVWIASSSGVGYYDIYSGRFTDLPALKRVEIRDIDVEEGGDIWLTSNNGIWKYSHQSGLQKIVSANGFSPLYACLLDSGDLVYTTNEGDVYFLDHQTQGVSQLKCAGTDADGSAVRYEHIAHVRGETVLLSTSAKKVLTMDAFTGEETPVLSTSTPAYVSEITSMMVRTNEFWIGTRSGLLIYNVSTRGLENQISGPTKEFSMNGIFIRCLFSDVAGNVWAGTYNEGLSCWMNYRGHFDRYTHNMYGQSMNGRSIRSLCFDADGKLWLGSEEGKICRYDSRSDSFAVFPNLADIRGGTVISSIVRVGNRLWVTVFGDGVLVLDSDSGQVVKRYHFPNDECMSFVCSRSGDRYIGTRGTLYRMAAGSEVVHEIPALDGQAVNCMLEDDNGRIWVGLYGRAQGANHGRGRGLGLFDPATGDFRMVADGQDNEVLGTSAIACLSRGEGGIIWVGTAGAGLCRVRTGRDGGVEEVRRFLQNDGLPSNSISAVVEDGAGHLWVSTVDGVACLDLATMTVIGTYFQEDKVVGSLFGNGAVALADDGTVFLGARNGMMSFNPEGLIHLFENKSLIINNVTTGTLDVRQPQPEEGKSVINSHVIRVKQLDAPVLTVSYSSMIYDNPNALRYECSLRKRTFSNTVVTASNHVSYMALRPGTYEFKVRIEGATGEENESSRKIIIIAPWYRSILANIIYLILFLCGILYAFQLLIRNRDEQLRRKEELHEAQRQKDVFKEKMDFMANITHEIRTPVSLIAILVDKIMGKGPGQDTGEELKSLKNNSNRLVELCNELLNFRRIQNNTSYILKSDEDLCGLVRKSLEPFKTAVEQKGIVLSIDVPDTPIHVQCDQNAVDCIISNLMSNAVKYGETRIDCRLSEENGKAVFRIGSDGTRIPEEESELIFNAFYQSREIASSGSGLGLTYSRTLAELHNGLLYLDTRETALNSFVFVLPITEAAPEPQAAEPQAEPLPAAQEGPAAPDDERPRILVVEDNEELRNLIRDELLTDYSIATASNGQEAIELIKRDNFDMVISDIMMPIMDGCELCNLIKSNVSYSHILVILLTAAIGVETHLRSLKAGVDSYIEKPFKIEVLKATIGNLFKNREIRNEQFNSNPLAWLNFTSISAVEREFMEKLHGVIMEHISETEMTTPQLASMMAVSRQTLATKVRANTGLSTLEYIRVCRLKKAAELIAERKYRIGEVAYLVGYTSPSYFTKHFQQQFGMTPSEFIHAND